MAPLQLGHIHLYIYIYTTYNIYNWNCAPKWGEQRPWLLIPLKRFLGRLPFFSRSIHLGSWLARAKVPTSFHGHGATWQIHGTKKGMAPIFVRDSEAESQTDPDII